MAHSSQKEVDIAGLSLGTRLLCADYGIDQDSAVAPGLHPSTTFRYDDDPDKLVPAVELEGDREHHVYSRITNPNMARLEALLSTLLGARAITYSSGLAAFHAMMVHLNPKRIAIGDGYHGCHGVLEIMRRLTGLEILDLDSCDVASQLGPGDVIHVETPCNPTGEARDISYYAEKAHSVGAYLTVDATFAPPPLLEPFAWGADVVVHSATKYMGGHSDMLCGVLAVHPRHDHDSAMTKALLSDRLLLGAVMGSLEGWLGMRSLRTMELRVVRQSATATELVSWLSSQLNDDENPHTSNSNSNSNSNKKNVVAQTVQRIQHASLQPEAAEEDSWLRKQMPRGYGPVFAIWMKTARLAQRLPSKLRLFHHATSLGGVESLIEWRAMSDKTVDQRLLRVSVGVEGVEDLKWDLMRGLEALAEEPLSQLSNEESCLYID